MTKTILLAMTLLTTTLSTISACETKVENTSQRGCDSKGLGEKVWFSVLEGKTYTSVEKMNAMDFEVSMKIKRGKRVVDTPSK